MSATLDTGKLARALKSKTPLLGRRRRGWALGELRSRCENPEVVRLLIRWLNDEDPRLRQASEQTLIALEPGAAQDLLCEAAIMEPSGRAAQFCIHHGKRPRDGRRKSLFFCVTGQIEAYLETDPSFQNLRREFKRADSIVKGHIMDTVLSGDPRLFGFLHRYCSPFSKLSDGVRREALEVWIRQQEWSLVFQAALILPLRNSLALIDHLRHADWVPSDENMTNLHKELLKDLDEGVSSKSTHVNNVFETWLSSGADYENVQLSVLLERIAEVDPPQTVAIVGALSDKGGIDKKVVQALLRSPHWMTRLAVHATGLADEHQHRHPDINHWVSELSSATGILEVWPSQATKEDLERLTAAPPALRVGRVGAARRALCSIISHHLANPSSDDVLLGAQVVAQKIKR